MRLEVNSGSRRPGEPHGNKREGRPRRGRAQAEAKGSEGGPWGTECLPPEWGKAPGWDRTQGPRAGVRPPFPAEGCSSSHSKLRVRVRASLDPPALPLPGRRPLASRPPGLICHLLPGEGGVPPGLRGSSQLSPHTPRALQALLGTRTPAWGDMAPGPIPQPLPSV